MAQLAKRKNASLKFIPMTDEGELRVDDIKETINEKLRL